MDRKNRFDYTIFLIGFMGSGKTAVADGLSKLLGLKRIEMDHLLVEEQQMSITDIFEQYGETHFRDLESSTLMELHKKSPVIVSCGGGIVMRSENITYMKKHGKIILLTASPETIFARVKNNKERPLLNKNMNIDFIRSLMEKRQESYENAADIIVETDHKSVADICNEIIQKLKN